MKEYKRKILSKIGEELLFTIQDVGQLMSDIAFTPYGQLRLHPRQSYYRGLRDLQSKGLVSKKKLPKKSVYVLTEKGRKLLRKDKQPIKRSDGFSTVIIFDIPEDKSKQRTIFRRYLLRNGYTILQKSVLISPDKLTDGIKELINELRIRPYISSLDARVTYLFSQ